MKKYIKSSTEADNKFDYQLLDRLKLDCEYFLGNGTGHTKYLWAGNVDDQIAKMRELYNYLPDDAKPDWLTEEDIDRYEQEMKRYVSSNTKTTSTSVEAANKTSSMVYTPSQEATELFCYITSTDEVYTRCVLPVINMLRKKIAKGVYDEDKAVMAFYNAATAGSNMYNKDYGYTFSVTDRYTTACDLLQQYQEELYDEDTVTE